MRWLFAETGNAGQYVGRALRIQMIDDALAHRFGGWKTARLKSLNCKLRPEGGYYCTWRFRSAGVWHRGYVVTNGLKNRIVETSK
jgi:hypothetical protein